MFYFLKTDYDKLDSEIDGIYKQLEKNSQEAALSCQQSSETWHDNFGFEEAKRQGDLLAKRLEELLTIKSAAYVLNENQIKSDQVMVGTEVSFKDEAGKQKMLKIGSYMSFSQDSDSVSYESPIGQALIGAKVGDTREAVIGGSKKCFSIVKIQ